MKKQTSFSAVLILLLLSFSGCKQDSAPNVTFKARSYSPYGSGEDIPLRWADAQLVNGLSLKISSAVAPDLDYGDGNNGYTDAALEWNGALPGKTFFALPITTVANRQKAQLVSYFDDEMGIYKADTWFAEVGDGALAITQFFGIRRTTASGQYIELQHADIILNYHDYSFSSDPNDFTRYDLPSVLLHEMGHFIGLRHEYSTYESVMRPSLGSYETERQLYSADIAKLEQNYGIQQTQRLNASASSNLRSGAVSSSQESEVIEGRFELRSDGRCVHFINGKRTSEHRVSF